MISKLFPQAFTTSTSPRIQARKRQKRQERFYGKEHEVPGFIAIYGNKVLVFAGCLLTLAIISFMAVVTVGIATVPGAVLQESCRIAALFKM